LHAGWRFSQSLLAELGLTAGTADPAAPASLPALGLLPAAAILLAGLLAHLLTASPAGENAAQS
jgi:hypothetical protein